MNNQSLLNNYVESFYYHDGEFLTRGDEKRYPSEEKEFVEIVSAEMGSIMNLDAENFSVDAEMLYESLLPIILNVADIKKAIWDGDNCNGKYYLVVSADKTSYVLWADNNRQWDNWTDDDKVCAIPAFDADGSGEGNEFATEFLGWSGVAGLTQAQVEKICEERNINAWELAEADYAEAFLVACQEGLDEIFSQFAYSLESPETWGFKFDERGNETGFDNPDGVFETDESNFEIEF